MTSKNLGFTLIEIVIAMVIGGVVLSIVASQMAVFIKQTQFLNLARQTQKEVHFAISRIADAVRAYDIQYVGSTGSVKNCSNGGKIIDDNSNGAEKICLKISETEGLTIEKSAKNIIWNNQNLFSNRVKVENLRFFITPVESPYGSNFSREIQLQPKVRINLSVTGKHGEKVYPLTIQTTISSRQYR